jgi:hypothetical protein
LEQVSNPARGDWIPAFSGMTDREEGMIIYDCEIEKGILGQGEEPQEGIEYCGGWRDFEGMGIACIGAYDFREDRYRVFCKDNLMAFQKLVDDRDLVVGYNSLGFDNRLCAANGIQVPDEKSYDLLVEIWAGAGFGPEFNAETHLGFGLGAVCRVNFNLTKSGYGGDAPVQWQKGEIGSVIDYCLNDVWLTRMVLDQVLEVGRIWHPMETRREIRVRKPGKLVLHR